MKQSTFSDFEYGGRKHITKRESFLNSMDALLPFDKWTEALLPHYHKGKVGRPPRNMEILLRMFLLKEWFSLDEKKIEDAISDSYSFRKFVGVNFIAEQIPSRSTFKRFQTLMLKHGMKEMILLDTTALLQEKGYTLTLGTITEAALCTKFSKRLVSTVK